MKEYAKKFYNSKEWQSVRQAALMRDNYLCRLCGSPAEEVHHIIHISEENINDVNITLNIHNLMCLCKQCHFEQHYRDKAEGHRKNKGIIPEYEFDEFGNIKPIEM